MHSMLCLGFSFKNNIDMSSTSNTGNVDIILQKSFILQICYGKIYFQKNHERIVVHLAKADLCHMTYYLLLKQCRGVTIENLRAAKRTTT